MKLLLNNKSFSYEQIKTGNYKVESSFEEKTLAFCNEWLNGQKEFYQKTSGSTGSPKIIKITRVQMEISAAQTVKALNLKANDIALVCLDPAYIAGKMMLIRAFEYKMKIIIVAPSASPLENIQESFDFVAMVPIQIENSLSSDQGIKKMNECKAILIGGAPVSESLAIKIEKLTCPVFSTYGMTETVSHIALKRLSSPTETHFTTIGDTVISTNDDQQLIIKGSITNNKELITNDRIDLFSSTAFNWLGRIDNVINSGGIKIQIEDIEKSIDLIFNKLNLKNEFFIAKIPNEQFGDRMVLFIESPKRKIILNLVEILKNKLEKYHCPQETIYVHKFKTTFSGKVNKPVIISAYY